MPRQETRQIKQIVGANLKAARTARAMTQHEVGVAVGATGPDVSRWEVGRVEPGPEYRQKLANLFFSGDVSALYRSLDEERVAA